MNKILYCLLLVGLFFSSHQAIAAVASKNDGSFCIDFYAKSNYKGENGVICGEVAPESSGGTKKGDITVKSIKAPSWLSVTLYEKPFYQGKKSGPYKGSQKSISPFHIGSVKWSRKA